jgi:hypothetical protein
MKSDSLHEKRELRLKIGRMRRRIDARIRSTQAEGRQLASWRTYVSRYPAPAVLAAFGAGLAGATVGIRPGILKRFGATVLRGAGNRAANLAWHELERWWTRSTGERS